MPKVHLEPRDSTPRVGGESSKRTFLFEVLATFGALALLVLLVVLAQIASANATELGDERTEDESPNLDNPVRGGGVVDGERRPMPPRNYFSLYPADSGAWTYDDLSLEEQEAVDDAREWAELSHDSQVHKAFGDMVRRRSRSARAETAARALGFKGMSSIGGVR